MSSATPPEGSSGTDETTGGASAPDAPPVVPPWGATPGGKPPRGWWREGAALLPDLGRLLRALLRDDRVPRRAKVLAAGVVGYAASPLDLLPDVVPGVGGVDDLVLLLWAVRRVVAIAGYDLVRELWTGTDDGFAMLIVLAGVER